MQTELIAPLDLSRVRVGSPVPVRVSVEWAGAGCMLRAGSIVQGHVVAVAKRSKSAKDSEVRLLFDAADCEAHHESAFPFRLVAVIGSDGKGQSTGQSGVAEAPPLADAIANSIGGPGGIRSSNSASAINSTLVNRQKRQLPAHILPGQVLGVKKTALSIGADGDSSTTIKAFGHDVRLEEGTSLILTHEPLRIAGNAAASPTVSPVRSSGFTSSATGGGGSELAATGVPRTDKDNTSGVPVSRSAAPEPVDETSICTGSCNVVARSGADISVQDSAATASIPLRALGYLPRSNREVQTFDYETVLTYLDAHHLLVTFDPHQLRERASGGRESVRRIRAVVLDPETHATRQVMEWRVQGDGQYLWQLGNGRILVHMGLALKELDPELKTLRSIPVDGGIAFVVASPDAEHLAIGTIRERYSEAARRDLEAVLADAPEETIGLRVLDRDRAVVLSATQSSKLPPPVLSNSGEVRLRGDGHTHWRLSEYRWDRTEHLIAATTSVCRPSLSTPADDLIFAVGCTTSGGRWYRMLRADGHPLLKGESASDEIQHLAHSTGSGRFAVRTVKAVRTMSYGQPFKKTDLLQERIAIYRSQDGASLAAITTADFVMSELAFALSPDGSQVAVVGNSSVLFYELHGR